MNLFQQFFAPLITLISLSTACGVFIHDMHVDKALFAAVSSTKPMEATAEGRTKLGTDPHTHPAHLSVSRDGADNVKALPRNRDRKNVNQKRLANGHHDNNYCLPLAGEWA